jgi:hypothetical protein
MVTFRRFLLGTKKAAESQAALLHAVKFGRLVMPHRHILWYSKMQAKSKVKTQG